MYGFKEWSLNNAKFNYMYLIIEKIICSSPRSCYFLFFFFSVHEILLQFMASKKGPWIVQIIKGFPPMMDFIIIKLLPKFLLSPEYVYKSVLEPYFMSRLLSMN